MRTAHGRVVEERVRGIGEHEGGRCEVLVVGAGAAANEHGQIVAELVAGLASVLEDKPAALDIVQHVGLKQQGVSEVDVDGAVEGPVDDGVLEVGSHHVAVGGEGEWVATDAVGLACVCDFDVRDADDCLVA